MRRCRRGKLPRLADLFEPRAFRLEDGPPSLSRPNRRVDRATKWGNRFLAGQHGGRERAVRLHRRDLCQRIAADPALLGVIQAQLGGADLGCHCVRRWPPPRDWCHAVTLVAVANSGSLLA